jgi:hypothetical protein
MRIQHGVRRRIIAVLLIRKFIRNAAEGTKERRKQKETEREKAD